MYVCPFCGQMNIPGTKVCRRCRATVPEKEEKSQKHDEAEKAEVMRENKRLTKD